MFPIKRRHATHKKKKFFLHKIRDIRNRNVSRILDQGKKRLNFLRIFVIDLYEGKEVKRFYEGATSIPTRRYESFLWQYCMFFLFCWHYLCVGLQKVWKKKHFICLIKLFPFLFFSLSSRLQNIMKYIFVQVKGYKMYI